MTYEIAPEHFGFSIRRKVLVLGSFLVFLALWPAFFNWITNLLWPHSPWFSPPLKRIDLYADTFGSVIMGIAIVWWWSSAHHYSLEIDDNTARVGGRVVRKGRIRYMRELDGRLLRGPRLILSEHGPLWVQFLGGTVEVPKGLPEFEQIKLQVSTWMLAPHAEK
jgi:hypothetical protein